MMIDRWAFYGDARGRPADYFYAAARRQSRHLINDMARSSGPTRGRASGALHVTAFRWPLIFRTTYYDADMRTPKATFQHKRP